MRKFILAAVAASIFATPVMAAPQQHGSPQHRVVQAPQQHQRYTPAAQRGAPAQYRTDWRRGERFDSRQARNYRQIDYRQVHGLRAPPHGHRYVQSGSDVVMVAITTGIIASVLTNVLR